MTSTYACILAGGSGERFWPLSRTATPKHLIPLLSEHTLLEETVRRVALAVPLENIFILTHQAQVEACRAALPHLAPEQFVAEPAKRDTAPACALGTALVRRRDPHAVVAFLPADGWIQNSAVFAEQFRAAAAFAATQDSLVTLGIRPTRAATGFGYLEMGEVLPELTPGCPFYRVKKFKEKPDEATAHEYQASGRYLWNAGIFFWRIELFLREATRLQPELARFIQDFPAEQEAAYLAREFPLLPRTSIDYAIMEKAERVATAEAQFDWDDVGTWTALPPHLVQDEQGNTLRGEIVVHESKNNIVISRSRLIALHGVENLVVVETADALLVCHRDWAEKIKQLQPLLPPEVK